MFPVLLSVVLTKYSLDLWRSPKSEVSEAYSAHPVGSVTDQSRYVGATFNMVELSGSGHPDRDPLHRDKELLVNPLSLYWLHIWWGADRMYFRMCSVLQGHNELEGLVLIHNRDV